MLQPQIDCLTSLLSLALLLTACQPASEPDRLPPQDTAISQVATVASPTALPTSTNTPSPTATPSPSATPTLARTSQGDQLPTRSPTSAPTPTAIPAEEPVPATIATRPLPTPTLAPVGEVDLPALEESLVLLDRLDRRQGKPMLTQIRPITYEGGVVSYMEKNNQYCFCPDCDKHTFSAEIYIEADGTITGQFFGALWDNNYEDGAIRLSGTVNSVTGTVIQDETTVKLQAKLFNNSQKFDGTIDETYFHDSGQECGDIQAFSLDRK